MQYLVTTDLPYDELVAAIDDRCCVDGITFRVAVYDDEGRRFPTDGPLANVTHPNPLCKGFSPASSGMTTCGCWGVSIDQDEGVKVWPLIPSSVPYLDAMITEVRATARRFMMLP